MQNRKLLLSWPMVADIVLIWFDLFDEFAAASFAVFD